MRTADRIGLLLLMLTVAPVAAEAAGPGGLEDRFEIHGRVVSRAYFRSPNFHFDDEFHMSSWRNELWLEPLLRLKESDGWRIELAGVIRPTYDAVYDLYPNTWSERARGGEIGTGSHQAQKRALKGEKFPGHGACIIGEFCLGNQDILVEFTNKKHPGLALNPVLAVDVALAPVAAQGHRQPKVGGNAGADAFELVATGETGAVGAFFVSQSLALSGTTVSGSAPNGIRSPLNSYAGAKGDRGSFDQLPADINRSDGRLAYGCADNANPECWLRELYLDAEYGNTVMRFGRQVIAWGKMDSFQLQDVINPLDEGQHNLFVSIEERRIPVWAVRGIQSLPSLGPLEDISLDVAWVVDKFRPKQIGQCGEPYAFSVSCSLRLDALSHGQLNLGLAGVEERDWQLGNSEVGARMEFYLPKASITFSISGFWGFQDLPVLESKNLYSTDNPNASAMLALQSAGLPSGVALATLIDLLGGNTFGGPWTAGFDTYARDASGRPVGSLDQANRDLQNFYQQLVGNRLRQADDPREEWETIEEEFRSQFGISQNALVLPWSGGEYVAVYPRVFTLGGSLDYDVPWVDAVLRLETAYDFDRGLTNTAKARLRDSSDVFKLGVGIDRPTTIPFVSPDRGAFISVQLLWEHILDYDNGRGSGDGMVDPEDLVFTTFYMTNRWFRDRLELTNYFVADWSHTAFIYGPKLTWSFNDYVSFDVGLNMISGRSREHGNRDICPDGGFDCLDDPTTWNAGQTRALNRNLQRTAEAPYFPQGFGDHYMEQRDEVWVGLTWRF
jgi:hypothetical protein